MKVDLKKITVQELVKDYHDDGEDGVVGYGGKLDIRPKFQRNYVYDGDQRDAVIETVMKGFPLNVMYWADREDDTYEIIDGQQRTISISQYVGGDFSINIEGDQKYWTNLTSDQEKRILDYELMVYVCTGTDSEKLDWFRTINIAGVKLTDQELRNAVYAGSWVTDAKRHFSAKDCAAYEIGKNYISGAVNRQEYLETTIKWISQNNIEDYMGLHQHDDNAKVLWEYFESVIDWIESCFIKTRPYMKSVNWGKLHGTYKDVPVDPVVFEEKIERLEDDLDVKKEAGIYSYLFTGNPQDLEFRTFRDEIKRAVYKKQDGKCNLCGEGFGRSQMEADHITPWVADGRTIEENCQMLCRECNRRKGAK